MKKHQWLAILMVMAILGITGFQLYWLKQNYTREEKSLTIKTKMSFQETIMRLQAAKLNLDIKFDSGTLRPGVRFFMTGDEKNHMEGGIPRQKEEIVSTVNIIRDKLKDSLRKTGNNGVIVLNKTTVDLNGDTMEFTRRLPKPHGGKDFIFNMLYGVDSLQDSITLEEIHNAYKANLVKQKLNIPFTVLRIDSLTDNDEQARNGVTVGFTKPVTYQLRLDNTFPYLLRQLALPILFSILLLGITLLTFVLLYRNVLKQQRLAALKNEFISNITHELKTPIATVGVAIEALKNFNAMQDPQRTKEYLDISSNELQRLGLLVDKVLKLSMFENKGIELKYETLDIQQLVTEVVSSFKLQFEKFHAGVQINSSGDVTLRGDRLHLLSVIFNLVDNALKYSKENPEIIIDIQGKENTVELSVADNGIGIPAIYQAKIFEKFFRVPHGDTHDAKGYGLGLSYAAQVIKKHNGTIALTSEPGNGTTFTISIPQKEI